MMLFAYRGGRALGPENTISTMQESYENGADGLHVDIRCSLDDVPVLLHDATVDRTTNGSGEVYRIMADKLAELDAGEGRHLPTLVKTLEHFRRSGATLLLELKHPATALPTPEVENTFITSKNVPSQRIVVVTFYHQLLALIKDKFPKMTTGAMVRQIPESLAACGEYTKSRYIMPPIDLVTPEFIEDARSRSLLVVPWVADSDAQLAKARELGVDGVMLSNPKSAAQG